MSAVLRPESSWPGESGSALAPVPRPSPLEVGIVADMLEEGWPSMDLMAEVLVRELPRQNACPVTPRLVRPSLVPVIRRVRRGQDGAGRTADRVFNRFWLYRRALVGLARRCDVFHIVDHSYAHLVLALPRGRTIVTCHDTDTFRGFVTPGPIETGLPRFLVRRLARGLRQAALVVCPSQATASAVVAATLATPERVLVVPNGVDPVTADPAAEREADRLLARNTSTTDILHVGSAIPRKRLDVVIDALARIAARRPDVRLVRVGGPFTPEQEAQALDRGVHGRVLVLPFLPRGTLQAVYRRTAMLLLPSDREGFGLPIVEAMAAGRPVVARDLRVLREVAGDAAVFVQGDNADDWAETALRLLDEQREDPAAWRARCDRARARSAAYSWRAHAETIARIYASVARRGDAPGSEALR